MTTKKYFILLDSQKNTIKINVNDSDMLQALRTAVKENEIKQHSTQTALFNEIREYLKENG